MNTTGYCVKCGAPILMPSSGSSTYGTPPVQYTCKCRLNNISCKMDSAQNEIDNLRGQVEALRKENEALKAHVERLREALDVYADESNYSEHFVDYGCYSSNGHNGYHVTDVCFDNTDAKDAISETPQQSLAAIRNETLEKAANDIMRAPELINWPPFYAQTCAEAVRAMKVEE